MIRTDRLVLRRAEPGDLDALHAIMTDARAMRYWDRPAYTDIAETQQFLDALIAAHGPDALDFIIERDGQCIGKMGIWKRYEFGYILHPDHWQQGVATEAARAILPAAFDHFPDMDRLEAELDPRNTASAALLTRLGFAHLRTEEKNFLYGADEWCDTAYYALSRTAFAAS